MSKSQSTKVHFYKQSTRLIAMSGVTICNDRHFLYIVPPEKALSIENLFVHLKLTFDAAIASGNRVLNYIGVSDEIPLLITGTANRQKKFTLNQAADANRVIDLKIDLTSLLKKDNVAYRELFDDDPGNATYVEIKFPDALRNVANIGTFNIWKIDAQFTTEGIV